MPGPQPIAATGPRAAPSTGPEGVDDRVDEDEDDSRKPAVDESALAAEALDQRRTERLLAGDGAVVVGDVRHCWHAAW